MNAQHFQTAADVLDREAKRFQQLSEAATALRGLGELASMSDSLEARAAKAREELAAVDAKVEEAKAALNQAQTDAAKVVADAWAMAAEEEEKAAAKAKQLVADAEARASSIVEEGGRRVENMVSEARSAVATEQSKQQGIAQAVRDLEGLIQSKSRELADIEDKIRMAREKIAAFAGGN